MVYRHSPLLTLEAIMRLLAGTSGDLKHKVHCEFLIIKPAGDSA